MTTVTVPDIGDFKNVPIIEIHVKPGQTIKAEDPIVTLESDKATMEVPAPQSGTVGEVLVKIGDKVSMGAPLVTLAGAAGATDLPAASRGGAGDGGAEKGAASSAAAGSSPRGGGEQDGAGGPVASSGGTARGLPPPIDFGGVHASPAVRRLARELDVDLTKIKGSGEKGRVTKDDVKRALGGGGGYADLGRSAPRSATKASCSCWHRVGGGCRQEPPLPRRFGVRLCFLGDHRRVHRCARQALRSRRSSSRRSAARPHPLRRRR